MKYAIETSDLTKTYGDFKAVYERISMCTSIQKKENNILKELEVECSYKSNRRPLGF